MKTFSSVEVKICVHSNHRNFPLSVEDIIVDIAEGYLASIGIANIRYLCVYLIRYFVTLV